MSMPTVDDLISLDYTHQGLPFCQAPAKALNDLTTMNLVYQGLPFVVNPGPSGATEGLFTAVTNSCSPTFSVSSLFGVSAGSFSAVSFDASPDFAPQSFEASSLGIFSSVSFTVTPTFAVQGLLGVQFGFIAGRVIRDLRYLILADGTHFMVFSYESLKDGTGSIYNIYYSISADGILWSEIAPLTNATAKNQDYYFPDIQQMDDGSLFIVAQENNTYLTMTKDTEGWIDDPRAYPALQPISIWYSADYTKAYVISVGDNNYWFGGCAEIDIATWTITKMSNGVTEPGIPQYFREGQLPGKYFQSFGVENYFPIVCADGVCLVDLATSSYRAFFLRDLTATYGPSHAQNVNWTPYLSGAYHSLDSLGVRSIHLDLEANRLYLYICNNYIYSHNAMFGYIDLDQEGPTYDFTEMFNVSDLVNNGEDGGKFYIDDGLILVWGFHYAYGDASLRVYTTAGALWKEYYYSETCPDFPRAGLYDVNLVNGDTLFATVVVDNDISYLASELYKHHILEIYLPSDIFRYHYFPFTTTRYFSNYALNIDGADCMYPCAATKEFIIGHFANPVVFNWETRAFTYTDYNPDGSGIDGRWELCAYNPVMDCFMGRANDNTLYMQPRNGDATRLVYSEGTFVTDWSFTTPAALVTGYKNTYPMIAHSETDEIWAFWDDDTLTTDNLSWGKTNAQLELSQYLTDEMTAEWSIDGEPNRLEFTLSHGHLFDPANITSILNYYLKKGNVVILKFGDNVSGTDYWQGQGTFIIRELKIKYHKGNYPTVDVMGEDMRCLWSMHQVTTAQVDDLYPDDAIKALVKGETNLADADFTLPVMTDRFTFDAMWVDNYLHDIIADICNRFKYFPKITVDNKVTAVRIDPAGAVSNTYSTKNQIVNFTPDDSFSDLVNRITVTGQSLDDIEVMYDEERLGSLSGTIGWWGYKKDFTVYYSDDMSVRAKQPRLKVIESTSSIMFQLAGSVTERIRYIDPYHKYCIVEVKAPNLIPMLLTAIGMYTHACVIGDFAPSMGGMTVPFGRIYNGVALTLITMILGSVCNYQYEIWGRPCGYVKRDYVASANDVELQTQIGHVIEQKEEGFLCHTQAHCQYIADFELLLAQLQRNRTSLEKIAHLKDEVGDVISVPHPYTSNPVKLMITDLKRKYKPATLEDKDGHFTDDVKGWTL